MIDIHGFWECAVTCILSFAVATLAFRSGRESHRKLEKPVVRTCSTAESPGMTAAKGAARGNTICGFLRRCALTCRLCPTGFLQHTSNIMNDKRIPLFAS